MQKAPERLKPSLEFQPQSTDSDWSRARVQCSCGSRIFKFYHNGMERRNLFGKSSLFVKDDGNLVVSAQCVRCSKSIRLFDSQLDACDCTNMDDGLAEPNVQTVCPKCGHHEWKIVLEMEFPNVDEEDDIVMQWLRISLQCGNCGRYVKNYLDIEVE